MIIFILAAALLLTACSTTENAEIEPISEVTESLNEIIETLDTLELTEIVHVHSDRIVFRTLERLLDPEWGEGKQIVVIGEFIEEAKSEFIFKYDEHFGKEIVRDVRSFNQLRITEVLQGDVQVGDIVTVVQRYAFEEGRFDNGDGRNALVTFSGMTPMNKGDKWIYFLGYDETVDAY